MSLQTLAGSRVRADITPQKLHQLSHQSQALDLYCREYLELRSHLESQDLETKQLIHKLGMVNQQISQLLGPQDAPIVHQVDGEYLVINIAEGLLMAGAITASVERATTVAAICGEGLDHG
jgi:hypothetical protein